MLTASGDLSAQPAPPPAMPQWAAPSDVGLSSAGEAALPPSFMPQQAPASPAYSAGYGPPPSDNTGVASLGDPPALNADGNSSGSLNGLIPDNPPEANPNAPAPPISTPGQGDFRPGSVHSPHPPGGSIYGGGGYGESGERPSASHSGRDHRPRVDLGPPDAPPSFDSPGPAFSASERPRLAKPPAHLSMGSGQGAKQGHGRMPTGGNETTYKVQPNDTLWSISKDVYGTDAYYKALAEHNRKKYPNPDNLQVGDVISVPPVEELTSKYPNACPKPEHVAASENRSRIAPVSDRFGGRRGGTYVVQQGDSLFDIAKYELGKASRWVEIYELNRDQLGENCNYLTPGMELAMPTSHAAGTVTQHPDGHFQR
jgi:nucleoid-associated protein YgaU